MVSLLNSVKQFIQENGFDSTYWIAYSGGMDSHVLLHVCAALREHYPLKLQAVYIHHGLSQHASNWGQHCRHICQTLDVAFQEIAVNAASATGQSPENIARDQRYAALGNVLAPADIVLTAHHQDDQAETVLLQLLRGSGPKGLSAMPRKKPFFSGFQGRPLLDLTRADLQNYAERHQLSWVEDESNTNTDLTRNFLRHEVLPLLAKRVPAVTKLLSRVATHCALAQSVVDRVAQAGLLDAQGSQPNTLSIKKMLTLDVSEQQQVLRQWLDQAGFPLPSVAKMRHMLSMLHAREDKTPHVIWGQSELRRYRDNLYAMPCLIRHDAEQVVHWDCQAPLILSTGSVLSVERIPGADIQRVTVRFRRGGEVFQLPGRDHHHDVKKLLQTWGVPPWLRDRIPLIYVDNRLVAIADYAIASQFLKESRVTRFKISNI